MLHDTSTPLPLYRSESLSRSSELIHAVTTRHGGTSKPPFHSLNLSFAVGDDPTAVQANRRALAAALEIDPAGFVAAQQPHGHGVAIVERSDRGRGAFDNETAFAEIDALVTNQPGLALLCFSADCPPVVVFDPVRRVVGCAHSGWRGTVAGIAPKMIRRMQARFACQPDELVACVGPAIDSCCFEIGPEVLLAIEQRQPSAQPFVSRRGGRTYFDIPGAIRQQLLDAGVPAASIEMSGLCTACRVDEFFSYRAENGVTGRFAAIVGLR